MRRRLWTLATLLLLALAAVPQPAAASERAVKPAKAAFGGLAAFWEGLRHLPFLASLRKLGPEMDPAGAPKPSSSSGGSSVPQSDLGPGIDPAG